VRPFVEDTEGRYIGCWCVTEPQHGSDVMLYSGERTRPDIHLECTARRDGDEWVIAGQKSAWVANGSIATHALVLACVDASAGMNGTAIAEHQLVQRRLFEMFTKLQAARSLSRLVHEQLGAGRPATSNPIAAGLFCTHAAFELASDAVEIFGGMGLAKESVVEMLFRDARTGLIAHGTSDVLALAGFVISFNVREKWTRGRSAQSGRSAKTNGEWDSPLQLRYPEIEVRDRDLGSPERNSGNGPFITEL
jgi:alkylation response protein AidB-like acyl-CoA dehydrogenase